MLLCHFPIIYNKVIDFFERRVTPILLGIFPVQPALCSTLLLRHNGFFISRLSSPTWSRFGVAIVNILLNGLTRMSLYWTPSPYLPSHLCHLFVGCFFFNKNVKVNYTFSGHKRQWEFVSEMSMCSTVSEIYMYTIIHNLRNKIYMLTVIS